MGQVNRSKLGMKFLVGSWLMALIFALTGSTQGSSRFFPLAKIKPGMSGYGYTVFKGTTVEKFKVKVLAVMDSGFRDNKLILVRLGGSNLAQNGGLSAGMSGSPVYIQGKLAGAISYGFENADPFLAFITPIETMLNLLKDKSVVNRQPFYYKSCALKPVPVASPVQISGMGRRGYELMKQSMLKYGLIAVYSPSCGIQNTAGLKATVRPGSAVSVQMISGDYLVAALGTVTYVDDRKFLAFGHPFTNQGVVNYLAYNAYIFHTVKSRLMSFRLGAPLDFLGRITEDRAAGILGQLGEAPDLIAVKVNVKDVERNQVRVCNFSVIQSEQAARDLIVTGVTDTIDQAINRVGGGTATVNFTLETGLQTLVSRRNLFYGKDIAVECVKDLKKALELVTANEYTAVWLKSVRVEAEISSGQATARIINLHCDRTKVKPGEMFLVKAVIHCYRGSDLTVPFTIKLPERYPPGKLNLVIQGGSREVSDDSETGSKKSDPNSEYQEVGSLAGLLAKFSDAPKNNELVLEYYPSNPPKSEEPNQPQKEDPFKPVKLRSATDYYIQGEAQLTLEVEN